MLLLLAAGGAYYYMNHDFRNNVGRQRPDFEMTSAALLQEFEQAESASNDKYLGKLIEVTGEIESFSEEDGKTTISLKTEDPMSAIVCELNPNLVPPDLRIEEGKRISIKGACSGKLMDIILVNCVISKR